MAQIKWIKLNVNMFDDEKIKIIQALPEGDALLIIWVKLILLAGKTNYGGYVYVNENMAYTDEMLSVIFNKPLPIIKLAIETFTKLGMIETDEKGIYLVNFEKYQSIDKLEELREYNRLAQQRHREKIKCQKMSLTSQLCQDTDKDIDIDIKEKKYIKKRKSITPKWLNEDFKKEELTNEEFEELNDLYKEFKK